VRKQNPRINVSQAAGVSEKWSTSSYVNQHSQHQPSLETSVEKVENNSSLMGNCYAKLSSDQQKALKAIRDGELNVLKKYRQCGMTFDFNENNPMREAVLSNKLEILKFLHHDCGIDLNSESGFAIR